MQPILTRKTINSDTEKLGEAIQEYFLNQRTDPESNTITLSRHFTSADIVASVRDQHDDIWMAQYRKALSAMREQLKDRKTVPVVVDYTVNSVERWDAPPDKRACKVLDSFEVVVTFQLVRSA